MNKEMKRQVQVIAVLMLCLVIICLTIAYALMSDKLSVTDNSKKELWDIHISDVSASIVGSTTYKLPTINGTNLNEFEVNLTKPGDSVTFVFDIINDGNVNAVLSNINKSKYKCSNDKGVELEEICNQLTYKFTKENGEKIEEGTVLYADTKEKVRLTIEYPTSVESLSTSSIIVKDIDLELNYIHE